MYQVIIVIHVLLGLGIIGLILIQQGKGADAGATFGGGASGSVFGAQGAASFLSKATATLAGLFFITSLGLAILNSKQGPAYDLMSTPVVDHSSELPKEATSGTKLEEMPVTPSMLTTTQPIVSESTKVVEKDDINSTKQVSSPNENVKNSVSK